MEYTVNWTQTFKNELHAIYYYIFFNLKEPITAQNNPEQIFSKVHSLSFLPDRFPKLYNPFNYNIRKLCYKNFIILYEVNHFTQQVYILHIFNR